MPHMASVATLTGVLANRLEHRSTYYSFIIPDLGPAPETGNRLDTADESGPRYGLNCILYSPFAATRIGRPSSFHRASLRRMCGKLDGYAHLLSRSP